MSRKAKNNPPNKKGAADSRPHLPLLRVCLLFFALVLGLHLLQWTMIPRHALEVLQLFTAKAAAGLIRASGIPLTLEGTSIFLLDKHWEVIPECTALSAFIVFASFVLAYPSGIKAKTLGLLIGLPFLFSANIFRLFALAWATRLSPNAAEVVHDYIWQVAFLLLLVLMWLAWIELVVKLEKNPAVSD